MLSVVHCLFTMNALSSEYWLMNFLPNPWETFFPLFAKKSTLDLDLFGGRNRIKWSKTQIFIRPRADAWLSVSMKWLRLSHDNTVKMYLFALIKLKLLKWPKALKKHQPLKVHGGLLAVWTWVTWPMVAEKPNRSDRNFHHWFQGAQSINGHGI